MTEEWGRPAETGGEFVKPAQLNGHLVIFFPIGYIPFIQTRFSGQSNKPSDGIVVDVVDLDDKDDYGNPGKLYRHNTFMQAQLIASLKSQIGSKILGVVGQGTARNGMNQPWVIVDMSGDPAARERGSQWIAANPNFRPSQFTPRAQQQPQDQYQEPARQEPRYQDNRGQGGISGGGGGGYQAPAQQRQEPAQQPQRGYAAVAGAPQLSDDEISVLEHYKKQRAAAEAERLRQASFEDQPPF